MAALVSIIIPVYNLESYIGNCLNSVIAQTYRNIEVICIDDGSTDKSADIIRSFAETDERIKYFYQDNSGVSVARNNGIDRANGEYIMFVDGDDYLHFQAVEIFLNVITEKNCNIVFADSIITRNSNDQMLEINNYTVSKVNENGLFSHGSDRAVWAKIFKADVVKKCRFPEGYPNGEDFCFMSELLYNVRNEPGYRINCILYYYFVRETSASYHEFSFKNILEIKLNELNAMFFDDKEDCYLKNYSVHSLIRSILYVRTRSIHSKYQKDTENVARQTWKRWRKAFFKSSGISLKDKIMLTSFYYSRHLYELARMIQDPTMKDYYKQRKKKELKK